MINDRTASAGSPAAEPPALTAATLPAYLARHGLAAQPEQVRARELTGGVSNRAWWVDRPEGPVVVKQARAQLAVSMEWRADVRRIIREAEAMAWLHERLGPPAIPRMILLDRDALALVMEAIPPPAANYKQLLLAGQADPALAEQLAEMLARIHNLTQDDATRRRFGDARFFDQLRMSPYYDTVAARHPPLAPALARLRRDCLESTWCLVHGDFSAKNLLLREGRLVLLDYEVAHFGNPSFDVGFLLNDYVMKALHLPRFAAALLECARRFWSVYRARVQVPAAALRWAGPHLAALMLARVDGKSPFEYFTDPAKQNVVRELARAALLAGDTSIEGVLREVEARAR